MGYLGSQPVGIYETGAQASARKKAEADAAKRAKELAALQKKNLTAQKQSNALTKAAKTLDLDRIGMTAALKGKISETDRLSLQLQLSLLDKNDAAAMKLSAELDAAIKRQTELAAALLATPKAPNPFSEWSVPKLDFGGNLLGSPVPNYVPPSYVTPETFTSGGGMGPQALAPVAPEINIKVEVAGEDVAAVITQEQSNQSLSGSFVNVNRLGRFANTPVAI
jgi:hypothetical protein